MQYLIDVSENYLLFKPENQLDAFKLGKLASKRPDVEVSFERDKEYNKEIEIKSVAIPLGEVFAILAGLDK